MTEGSEDGWLVRIRAQVMCRDEGTGGWVAVDGGGVANVMVGRRPSKKGRHVSHEAMEEGTSRHANGSGLQYEYYIYGKRISDDTEVLSCTIEKDFQYNKVMPTFHHWVTSEKRFGLTFQTAADARAFDRGVRTAVEEILNGAGGPSFARPVDSKGQDQDEDNIFECLELPSDSRSSSETSVESRVKPDDVQTPILSAITLKHTDSTVKHIPMSVKFQVRSNNEEEGEHCSYVQLTARVLQVHHEYSFVKIGNRPPQQDSGSPKNVDFSNTPPPQPEKKQTSEDSQGRSRCRYCNRWFVESANRPGICDSAPDHLRNWVDTISCLRCAQCMVYHCTSDPEGDFTHRPCLCVAPDGLCITPDESCLKRWLGLGVLSIFVPCLCLYPPLNCLRRVSVALGIYKPGKHHA